MDIVSSENKIMSSRSINVGNMREGLRSVILIGENMKETNNSYLLVNSQKNKIPKKQHNLL